MARWRTNCVFPGTKIEGQGGSGAGRVSRPGGLEEVGGRGGGAG